MASTHPFLLLFLLATIFLAGCTYFSKKTPPPSDNVTEYIACGCGCCPGANPVIHCIYNWKNESLMDVVADDERQSKSIECETAGCFVPIRYIYCD